MENRRDFFRTLGAFAAGVVGAKVASYIPKKEEKKEELMVSEQITIMHDGKEYHPLVVAKTPDSSSMSFVDIDTDKEVMRINSDGSASIRGYVPPQHKLRKLNS
jgi:hypothetical protein